MELSRVYRPLTACPALAEEYPPCAALRPYVRCFWRDAGTQRLLVVPDTCVDLLFVIREEQAAVRFCGLDDRAYYSGISEGELFGIRFYAWAAERFTDDGLQQTFRGGFAGEQHFTRLCSRLLPRLPQETMQERIDTAQQTLLECLRPKENRLVNEAVGTLLVSNGALSAAALARELHISTRQLERELHRTLGTGPKRLADLIRYQLLWQELLRGPGLPIQDAVQKYGFVDQAHLQNTFKKYHSMTPRQAVCYARQDVAILQYKTNTAETDRIRARMHPLSGRPVRRITRGPEAGRYAKIGGMLYDRIPLWAAVQPMCLEGAYGMPGLSASGKAVLGDLSHQKLL